MLTQRPIKKKEHFEWIEHLSNTDKQKFWVVFLNDNPIGSVYLQKIDHSQLSAEWGFYIGEDDYTGKGLAKRIVWTLLQYFFEVMRFNVLVTKVFCDNSPALHIYRQFHFVEMEKSAGNEGRQIVTFRFSSDDWKKHKKDYESECL